jgi:hypothetical protein
MILTVRHASSRLHVIDVLRLILHPQRAPIKCHILPRHKPSIRHKLNRTRNVLRPSRAVRWVRIQIVFFVLPFQSFFVTIFAFVRDFDAAG